jgi:hypothetical protein
LVEIAVALSNPKTCPPQAIIMAGFKYKVIRVDAELIVAKM